jgi:tetratricopeptide (TPR) repeat protein
MDRRDRFGRPQGSPEKSPRPGTLTGKSVALHGRFAGATQQEIAQILQAHGARIVDRLSADVDYLVLGERDYPLGRTSWVQKTGSEKAGSLPDGGRTFILSESDLWAWLGLLENREQAVGLWTVGAASELVGVDRWLLRRWIGLGLLRARSWVFRSPYLDFSEVVLARRLASWVKAGLSPTAIESALRNLARHASRLGLDLTGSRLVLFGGTIVLQAPEVILDPRGQTLLFRPAGEVFEASAPPGQSAGLADLDPGGSPPQSQQFRARDENLDQATPSCQSPCLADLSDQTSGTGHGSVTAKDPLAERIAGLLSSGERASAGNLRAEILEEAGKSPADHDLDQDLAAAIEAQRLRLLREGPNPEGCFQLAELLYRAGQLQAARERYWMALELDENFVEARTNLACVLAELGETDLALAALRGSLSLQPDYPDAHWHLARLLDTLGRTCEARQHWEEFLRLVRTGPWAEVAAARLAQQELLGAP